MKWIRGFLLVCFFFGVLGVCGCPGMPPVDNCKPKTFECRNGKPAVCSPSQRWTPMSAQCNSISNDLVCCNTTSVFGGHSITACVPRLECLELSDGGVND
jgi:hypothetical protein